MRVAKNNRAGGHARGQDRRARDPEVADDNEMCPVELPEHLALVSAELDVLAVLAFEIADDSYGYTRRRADAILEHLVKVRTWQTFVFAEWRELTGRVAKAEEKRRRRTVRMIKIKGTAARPEP